MSHQTSAPETSWMHLLDINRNHVTERSIYGAVAIASPSKRLDSGPVDPVVFGRSLMKSYQMKVLAKVLDLELDWEEKALSLASHNGETAQVEVAKRILPKAEWADLRLPPSLPLRPRPDAIKKDQWLNPCSGKHAAILRACDLNGWPRGSYTSQSHPYFRALRAELESKLNTSLESRPTAPDGCLLPMIALSVSEMARLFAHLAAERNQDWIWKAHHEHPELIGGTGRFDTMILKTQQNLLVKEGADGLLGIAIAGSSPIGVVIKLAHGFDPTVSWHLARALMSRFIPEAPDFPGQDVDFSESLLAIASELRDLQPNEIQ